MSLQDIREEIDKLDAELTGLFCCRMELAQQIAAEKSEQGLKVHDRVREREVLARVGHLAGDTFEQYARTLYSVLFDLSRSYQTGLIKKETALTKKIRESLQCSDVQFPKKGVVACQGLEGSYSQMACDKLFSMPDIMYFRNFEAVFQAVEQGLCDYGILPIENSSNGSVNAVYDLMRHYNFYIVRSIRLHIDHNLLAKPGAKLSEIKEIISHEQALGQCSEFLNKHPEIKVTVCENTATAAKMVSDADRRDIATLSSRNCARLYDLEVLSAEVQNSENNYTRFICIAKDLTVYPGADRISLMLSVEHTPGALYRMIARFAALGLNLTKLESRPIPGRDFEFLFYFDLEASAWSDDVVSLLGECSESDELFVFLGSYSEIR
ncbi:MAG: chorismate mutase [Oscillospiraceae bacterium]|jgi:chorismate mutase/prephenate dehydratase|nr:chorismate mutase [Oscillospiraceae bacterium]